MSKGLVGNNRKQLTTDGQTHIHILNTDIINTKYQNGDNSRSSTNLRTTFATLIATLELAADYESRKLHKETTQFTHGMHTTWQRYIDHETIISTKKTSIYATTTTHQSLQCGDKKRNKANHDTGMYTAPSEHIHKPCDVRY